MLAAFSLGYTTGGSRFPASATVCRAHDGSRTAVCTMQSNGDQNKGSGFESFVGSLLKVAEDTAKAASDAADQWALERVQVKIQPNALQQAKEAGPEGSAAPAQVTTVAPIVGMAGASGSLAQVEETASSLLATEGAIELQDEFCTFLTPREGTAYRTTEKGEVIFSSREDLAALVAEFSYGKLKELAAAARALTRYVRGTRFAIRLPPIPCAKRTALRALLSSRAVLVLLTVPTPSPSSPPPAAAAEPAEPASNPSAPRPVLSHRRRRRRRLCCAQVEDLESELEAADDAVVKLRREVTSSSSMLEKMTSTNNQLQSQADELALKLAQAEQDVLAKEAAIAEAERAAERAAEQLLDSQTQAVGDAAESAGEATARAVKLEQELMAAESAQEQLLASKAQLEASVTQLKEAQQAAAEERNKEAARVRELEQQASAAEAKAEAKAESLAASEASVASLQKQLDELKRALDVSNAGGAAAPPPSAPPAAETPAANGVASSAGADAAATPDAKPKKKTGKFDDEAARLTQEIEAQISAASGVQVAKGGQGRAASGTRKALSRMKKAELVEECEERKIEAQGTMAELRAGLRIERKRDALVAELVERGWSERQCRSALKATGWDADAALAKLLGT